MGTTFLVRIFSFSYALPSRNACTVTSLTAIVCFGKHVNIRTVVVKIVCEARDSLLSLPLPTSTIILMQLVAGSFCRVLVTCSRWNGLLYCIYRSGEAGHLTSWDRRIMLCLLLGGERRYLVGFGRTLILGWTGGEVFVVVALQ
ncbi:unnamed protein product [Ectocarpus sp. 12 AP-2014]